MKKNVEEKPKNDGVQQRIQEALNILSERERKVIQLRFGLQNGHPRTFEEASKEFGATRYRIRQIESRALEKLRLFNEDIFNELIKNVRKGDK